jgi:hypothetical protein
MTTEYDDEETTVTNVDVVSYVSCRLCGDDVHPARTVLGYRVCMECGDQLARDERAGWCIVQTYGKGPYQFVTREAAPKVLMDTNQKAPRS